MGHKTLAQQKMGHERKKVENRCARETWVISGVATLFGAPASLTQEAPTAFIAIQKHCWIRVHAVIG